LGISYEEVVFRKALNTDHSDNTINGGPQGPVIINDVLNSIFPEITATERENGVTRRTKMFITNESANREMKDSLLAIVQDILPPEKLRLFAATENTYFRFLLDTDVLGGDATVVAGTNIDIKSLTPSSASTSDIVGRKVKIDTTTYTIDSAPSSTEITFAEDVNTNYNADTVVLPDDLFDSVENDESFVNSNALINSVMSSSFQNGSSTVDIAIAEKDYFAIGDNVVVMDGYFRVLFRCTVDDVQDHATDVQLATITLNKTYTGSVTVPSGEGFIAGALKRSIPPGRTMSFWLELIVSPSSSVEDEAINQFKINTYFDDVTA
jgi:hypothetical protein